MEVEGFDSLAELALDLRCSWNHAIDDVWQQLDPNLWGLPTMPGVSYRLSLARRGCSAIGGDSNPMAAVKGQASPAAWRVRRGQNACTIHAESVHGADHLGRLLEEVQAIVNDAMAARLSRQRIKGEPE